MPPPLGNFVSLLASVFSSPEETKPPPQQEEYNWIKVYAVFRSLPDGVMRQLTRSGTQYELLRRKNRVMIRLELDDSTGELNYPECIREHLDRQINFRIACHEESGRIWCSIDGWKLHTDYSQGKKRVFTSHSGVVSITKPGNQIVITKFRVVTKKRDNNTTTHLAIDHFPEGEKVKCPGRQKFNIAMGVFERSLID